MLQILLGITRYKYQVITRYNSVILGFKTEINRVVLSYTKLYRVIPKMILEPKNGPFEPMIYKNFDARTRV